MWNETKHAIYGLYKDRCPTLPQNRVPANCLVCAEIVNVERRCWCASSATGKHHAAWIISYLLSIRSALQSTNKAGIWNRISSFVGAALDNAYSKAPVSCQSFVHVRWIKIPSRSTTCPWWHYCMARRLQGARISRLNDDCKFLTYYWTAA
jgi:hypothetical protein